MKLGNVVSYWLAIELDEMQNPIGGRSDDSVSRL